ncbi:MAG: 4Fe-4S binding protein [Microbacter sp.]
MNKLQGRGGGSMGQGRGRGFGFSSFWCVCPQCGYAMEHQQGVPCDSLRCPVCGVPLRRQDSASPMSKPLTPTPTAEQKIEKKGVRSFPQVNPDLCTGCAKCLSSCPTDAIKMNDGKAFIVVDLCRNCRICVRVCPEGAIG